MNRSRSAFAGLALAVVALGGCTGGDASQSDVQAELEERLTEDGYVAERGAEPVELDAEQADRVATCVARTMFEDSERFSPEERNAATSSKDGDEPDPDLVAKVEELVTSCYESEVEVEGAGSADDEGEEQTSDEETTTTTEG